jgi:hypothetical protein
MPFLSLSLFRRVPVRRAIALSRIVVPMLGLALLFASASPSTPAGESGKPTPVPPTTVPALPARQKHLAALGLERWQAAGVTGKGVKIAILDTGFRGYHDHLGKALPEHVTTHSFRRDANMEARDSQHGILCAEVIHAIAPDADLLLADWDVDSPEEFLAAVRWARDQGARIISCSVVMPSCSDGEGGGTVHRDLDSLLGSGTGPHDLLCFASAGNTIDRHWCGPFHDGGQGLNEWAPGKTDNPLSPWSSEQVAVHLYGHVGAGYELSVLEAPSDRVVAKARTDDAETDRVAAVVRFQPEAGHAYRVRVRRMHGPADSFHLTSMFASIEYRSPSASVCFPADGAHVVAMGAVDTDGNRQWYSACGPNSTCPKPDLVATVPFPSLWRARPFGGTSAAAPQAAAVAALWWSRHPQWHAADVRESMRSTARDLAAPGHDWETGYGLIQLQNVP